MLPKIQTGNIPVHSDHGLRISIELPEKHHFNVYFTYPQQSTCYEKKKKNLGLFYLLNFLFLQSKAW